MRAGIERMPRVYFPDWIAISALASCVALPPASLQVFAGMTALLLVVSNQVHAERPPNLNRLSPSDIEALEHGLSIVRDKSFDEIFELTHSDPAYVRAVNGAMDYREFIPDSDPDKKEKAEDLSDTAPSCMF